ncbi:MAG: hypothetical protein ACJASM_002865 [Salibacteraceae bacterium]|jgi:hypothetical protein
MRISVGNKGYTVLLSEFFTFNPSQRILRMFPQHSIHKNVATHMKKTFLILLMLSFSIGICQSKTNFENILSQKIDLSFSSQSELETLNSNVAQLIDCGIEQIDVDTFANGPILASLLIPMVPKKGKDLTCQDLFDKIIEFKQRPEYEKMIETVKVSNELSERKADFKNWEDDKK